MATLTHQGALLVSAFIFTCLPETFATSCQVYPSEYAYLRYSVKRSESVSANCRKYPHRSQFADIHQENYIHCNGTQLKLADSDLGSEQYSSSDYYVWPATVTLKSRQQLLFIFPARVNLTTITLHYYSDSDRGLPRLRFFAVPDDFHIWDALTTVHRYVKVASVPPGGEPPGQRNISITVNFNTEKVLMIKFGSSFHFAVSEVEFFICNQSVISTISHRIIAEIAQVAITNITVTKFNSVFALPITEPSTSTSGDDAIQPLQTTDSITDCNSQTLITANRSYLQNPCITSVREVIAWTLVAVFVVLLVGLLTINLVMLWIYKKRQSKDNNVETAMCEMEGNPCYETSNLKKTADTAGLQEAHVYERVEQN